MRTTRSALLLDALGTIIALQPPAPALRRELLHRFGLEFTTAQATRALAAEISYYRAHLQQGRDESGLAALRAQCAEVLRAALPDHEALAAISTADLTEALLASLRFTPFPDTRPALLAAHGRGERVIVVSNWDLSLHGVLAQLGLDSMLDGVLTSAEIGVRKPAAAIFQAALTRAGTVPERATHVGDSLDEDVTGARAAGLHAVLLRRDGEPGPSGVETIASLTDLT